MVPAITAREESLAPVTGTARTVPHDLAPEATGALSPGARSPTGLPARTEPRSRPAARSVAARTSQTMVVGWGPVGLLTRMVGSPGRLGPAEPAITMVAATLVADPIPDIARHHPVTPLAATSAAVAAVALVAGRRGEVTTAAGPGRL